MLMNDLQHLKDIPIMDVAGKLGLDLKPDKNIPCFKGHGERTPCLHIYTKTNSFKCYSCGIGGSTIDLVKEYRNCLVKEAIQWIKEEFRLFDVYTGSGSFNTKKTPYRAYTSIRGGQEKAISQNNGKITANPEKKDGRQFSDIYRYFIDLLDYEQAIEYLHGRGIDREITLNHEIKTLPRNNALITESLLDKYKMETLLNAGLFSISKNNKPYFAFFDHRLIIPYFDIDGKIRTLQGRNIDNNEQPKYKLLSGIKTALYNLKALQNANENGKKICICEGFIDVLSVYQLRIWDRLGHPIGIAGVNNFNNDYFDLLENYSITIATDGDPAGQIFYRDFVKKYKARFFLIPEVIDWKKVKGGKDINELLQSGVYSE